MKNKTIFTLSMLMILVLACNLSNNGTGSPASTPALPPSEVPSAERSTPIPLSPSTDTQHQTVPVNLPDQRSNHAGDYDSSTTARGKRAVGGDRFTYEQFERPFNANTMDIYFPYLDIVDTLVYQDKIWIYGTILLKEAENNALPGKYAIQLDMDVDGKGDWLVMASNPSSTEWTTNGVQVFQDANRDVGAKTAMFSDKGMTSDGFETKIFDSGQGNDPDAAWVRIAPDNPAMVQIALKRSLFGDDDTYLVNMWAGNSLIDPALFDLSDHFTHEQAGSADPGFEIYYPIKAVAELDNSCRMAVGFQPTGKEPGLCKEFKPAAPGEPGAPSCPNTCPYGQMPYPDCSCLPG